MVCIFHYLFNASGDFLAYPLVIKQFVQSWVRRSVTRVTQLLWLEFVEDSVLFARIWWDVFRTFWLFLLVQFCSFLWSLCWRFFCASDLQLEIWAFDITIMVVLLIDYWFEDESFEDWTFDIKNLGVFALRFNRCWGGDCDVIAPIDTNLRIIWPTTLCKILPICLVRSGLICGSVQLWGFFYKVSKLAQKGIPSSLSVVWLVHLVLRGRELEFERGEGGAFIYQIHH